MEKENPLGTECNEGTIRIKLMLSFWNVLGYMLKTDGQGHSERGGWEGELPTKYFPSGKIAMTVKKVQIYVFEKNQKYFVNSAK